MLCKVWSWTSLVFLEAHFYTWQSRDSYPFTWRALISYSICIAHLLLHIKTCLSLSVLLEQLAVTHSCAGWSSGSIKFLHLLMAGARQRPLQSWRYSLQNTPQNAYNKLGSGKCHCFGDTFITLYKHYVCIAADRELQCAKRGCTNMATDGAQDFVIMC